MGFHNDDHIIKHVTNKTIKSWLQDDKPGWKNCFWIIFTDLSSIRIYPHGGHLICTPFDQNKEIKQSTDIEKDYQAKLSKKEYKRVYLVHSPLTELPFLARKAFDFEGTHAAWETVDSDGQMLKCIELTEDDRYHEIEIWP